MKSINWLLWLAGLPLFALCANIGSPWLNIHLLHLLFVLEMNGFGSQTQEENQSPCPLLHHTHSHREQSLGGIWAFPQELWSKCGSGGLFLRSSLNATGFQIFEMDPTAVDGGGLMASSGTCLTAEHN